MKISQWYNHRPHKFHPVCKLWFFPGDLLSKYFWKYMLKICIMCLVLYHTTYERCVVHCISLMYVAARDTAESASTIFNDVLVPSFSMFKALVFLCAGFVSITEELNNQPAVVCWTLVCSTSWHSWIQHETGEANSTPCSTRQRPWYYTFLLVQGRIVGGFQPPGDCSSPKNDKVPHLV